GRMTGVKGFVEELAKSKPVPPDWCYVNNFKNPYEPLAIELPAGNGREFAEDIKNMINSIRELLPGTFKSKDYGDKKEALTKNKEAKKEKLLQSLNNRVKDDGFVLHSTQIGLFIIPAQDGKAMSEEQYQALSRDRKDEITLKKDRLNKDLKETLDKIRDLDKKMGEDIRKLNHEVALYTIEKFLNDLKQKYHKSIHITQYIDDMQEDILKNINDFIADKPQATASSVLFPWMQELPFKKYEVNVIVDNSGLEGAPVIIEQNPTYQNLFGRIEKEAQLGVLSTDFTMIHGGSLHKANKGFLVIPVEELFRNIFSWDSLKMSLKDKKIIIEEASERLGIISTRGLKPQPIPLNIKVILIGLPYHYSILYNLDNDFRKLFKIKADYDMAMERTPANIKKFTSFMCTLCIKENLNHLDGQAIASVIEYSLRLAGDKGKISTSFAEISDIITEANFYALHENKKYTGKKHISKAVEEKYYRSNLIQEKIKEMIKEGTILIDVSGNMVGQVNGLSVINLGDFAFGRPSRVTVTAGMGKAGIIDIERETKLGGPIHTKGVLILSGYITEKFAVDRPLTLSARIVFEQSYSGVEGDSASSAELYALLSALSGVPINQNLAVTGSVNQKGQVQAIGGVNEKIEGFFEVCHQKGLNGKQGVLIPFSNIRNLMLKEEVINAVKEGKFHIYAVKDVDEGIEILTGLKAGKRSRNGRFPAGSINYMVEQKIMEFTEKLNKLDGNKKEEKNN
ncbi:MAG: AAA family ATPase, partial [Actinobacteria bacterium]|nr:AAA family ATPase [Actinomycetota bacterium]